LVMLVVGVAVFRCQQLIQRFNMQLLHLLHINISSLPRLGHIGINSRKRIAHGSNVPLDEILYLLRHLDLITIKHIYLFL
jgi:hypothetical protein